MGPTLALLLALGGCRSPHLATEACGKVLDRPGAYTCPVPGWKGRVYDVVLPTGYDGVARIPVVLAIHGGGGNRTAGVRTTCPEQRNIRWAVSPISPVETSCQSPISVGKLSSRAAACSVAWSGPHRPVICPEK